MMESEIANLIPEFLQNSETYSVIITDLQGLYIYVNDVFKKRFSFICEDFIGQHSYTAIYPKDHEKCNNAVEQVFRNPDKVVKVNLRKFDTNFSNYYWTEWEFSLFKDKNGLPIGVFCLGHDISETEKASKLAKEFAKKAETIIEEITDGFYILNREWEFIEINKVAAKLLGVPRKILLGKKIWDLFADTPDYNYPEKFRKAMDENITVSFEDYRADLDQWFSAVCYPSKEGLTVFFREITIEKKALDRLQYTESKLRALLDSTTDENILISKDYKILSFNKKANEGSKSVFGKPLKEFADIWDYVATNDKENFYIHSQKALNGENLKFEREFQKVWIEVSFFSAYNTEGKIIGFTFNITNIDKQIRKKLKLEETINSLNKTLEAIPHPIIIVNEQMCINYVNDEFENVFGYKKQEVINKNIDFLIPERYRNMHTQHVNNYLKMGDKPLRDFSAIQLAVSKNNQEINIKISLNKFTVDGEKLIIAILENVTEVFKKQNIILKQNETFRQIAWVQSHELRRPLANILGLCNSLKEDQITEEETKVQIDYLLKEANELDKIIYKIVAQTIENDIE